MIEEIVKKIENKQPVGKQLIFAVIEQYTSGNLSDEQFLPFIKAVYDYDISNQDLFYLTDAMMHSGEVLDLSMLGGVVDKHSTGGVSDTTTLIIAPICACLGVKMLKMSGRALGFTGGTCDKLECFTGYKTDIDLSQAITLTKQNGACMITSTANIAPADKKIYALRDRTGYVDSIPLIASSIMSKKLASGADSIVLDVKYGNGAFMPNKTMAKKLAKKMIALGRLAGKKIKVVYGKMNQPLGNNIGPRLEAFEAVQVLKGEKGNLYQDSVKLASHCVALEKKIPYFFAKKLVKNAIKSQNALKKLQILISSQSGSLELFSQELPQPTLKVLSNSSGKMHYVNTKELGEVVANLVKDCGLDYSKQNFVGIKTNFKNGDKIKKGDCLFEIYSKTKPQAQSLLPDLSKCYELRWNKNNKNLLFHKN